MAISFEPIFQASPNDAAILNVLQPGVGVFYAIRSLSVVNISSDIAYFRIYHDIDGTSFGTANAVFPYDSPLAAGEAKVYNDLFICVANPGAMAVRSSVASAFVFTAWGVRRT